MTKPLLAVEDDIEVLVIPPSSHWPEECGDCIFAQPSRDLYGATLELFCVRQRVTVSMHRDACGLWQHSPSATGKCDRCGDDLYDTSYMDHDKICSKSHYNNVKVERCE